MSEITIKTAQVGEIPILTMAQESSEERPIVFFLHGLGMDKRQGLPLGYELARLGFLFATIDAPRHGDRFDEKLEKMGRGEGEYVYPFESGLDLFFMLHEIVVQTAQDLERAIAYFDDKKAIDRKRIGVTGFSMGGFATFYAAANNPDVAAAVPIAAIPAFGERWSDVVLEASAYQKWAAAMKKAEAETVKRTAFMERIDPFHKLATFHPRPLMMISGDQDIHAPKKYSVDLYRMLKPLYAQTPEGLRLSIHDEAGHELTPAMVEETRDWFDQHLLNR